MARLSKRWRLAAYGAAGGAAVTLAASAIVLGPAGPSIASSLAQGQNVWRLGKLHVEGVEGSGLGNLRVKRATLADERGVWAVGENFTIAWKPWRLLIGDVALQGAHADKLTIIRRPELGADKGGGAVTIDTHLTSIIIDQVDLASGVAGPAAKFRFEGATVTRRGGLRALSLNLTRTDRPLDLLKFDYVQAPAIKLDGQLTGKPGGVFANLVGLPQTAIAARAEGGGDDKQGAMAFVTKIGGREASKIDLSWAPNGWRLDAAAHLDAAPFAKDITARFGPLVTIVAFGQQLRATGAPFRATIAGSDLSGEAHGKLDDEGHLVGAAPVSLAARDIAHLLPELDLTHGGARFEGAAEFNGDRKRFSGRLALDDWRRDGFALSAEGPTEIVIASQHVAYDVDLSAAHVSAPMAELAAVLDAPRLTAKGSYDRQNAVFALDKMQVLGPNVMLDGAGHASADATLLKGDWRVRRLGAAFADMTGVAQGRWTLASVRNGLALDVNGAGAGVGGASPLARLLGGAPKLMAKLSFNGPRAKLDVARLEGRALRVGATGMLTGAPTDVRLEASAHGPVDIAGMRLVGTLNGTGRVMGSLDAPRVYAEARLGALDLAGVAVEKAKISLDLVPARERDHAGRMALTGLVLQKPLSADAHVTIAKDTIAFDDLNVTLAQLVGAGAAKFGPNGADAALTLSGVVDGLAPDIAGAVRGTLTLSAPRKGTQIVMLDAAMRTARYGPRLAADSLALHAAGPMEAMKTSFAMKGWAGDDPLNLTGDGVAGFGRTGFVLTASAKGDFDGAAIATRAPAHVRLDGATLEANAALTLGAGSADIAWHGAGDRLTASGAFAKAPLPLLTAFVPQPLDGTITGSVRLSGAKSSLDGDLDFTLTNARLARRSREPIDATIKAQLGGGMLRGKIDAKAADGLVAHAEGQAPLIAQAAPFRLAPSQRGRGQARWSINGPVDGLWGLFGPMDQALTGRLDGAGDAEFGNGAVTGAGALTLASGGFEDKESGVKLRNIAARVEFDPKGVRLVSFNADDGKQGRVTGAGRLDGPDNGELNLTLTNMQLVDRADAKAKGGGNIKVVWSKGAQLSGTITLDQADMRGIGSNAADAVPVIAVTEINRAGPLPHGTGAPVAVIPVKFDLRVQAPGRVFTRTRGLDAEWSLDLRLTGDAGAPQVFGAARLVRGEFTLAGRRFGLDSGEMRFVGPTDDTEIALVATADAPDLTVHVNISGRAADPQIALTSEPALAEDEILPQLLFGRSSRELSALEAAQLAASLASLTGSSAFDIAGAARSAVDLDRLEVRPESTGGFLVSGGKYLTRDVYLEVSRGALGQTATAVEWQVKPRFYVISSFKDDGDQKVAVRWRKDY